uniref:rRNA adenine N(6)-methyltransferase n=1 Tax=Chromera velia CCMP2878 TaxID=1169474 RepID=A0A0G4I9J4_9ALVE|mmetsp:Transcript_27680/g.54302  ORF Transcript_27680/g.54302 Transcript_27680/m.54302 type:complete len:499 (+) Transcript_27680:389-1885(+)|eukprot:Cvel_12168.t1-p1 / transcript=Cvel_12168.t1 / gene=Cvel_12168 / organism=Chromera_velia_CCMP2878 / gene_product=Probable dimethyladenosine transferase, putative / transcript_product=Probable dimethyladenosine transferase, putative / location=Cvel_scaffold785:27297-31550(+) / protein_length=498 / sequence_SO=supercontig / SO=protein_coding / is_pseudo=false
MCSRCRLRLQPQLFSISPPSSSGPLTALASPPASLPFYSVCTSTKGSVRNFGALGHLGAPAAGFYLRKELGQHLLTNEGVLDKIVAACDVKSSDTVLEIGPGTGNLTVRLLPLARKVVALDVDRRMISEVQGRAVSLGFRNLEAQQRDALRSPLGRFDICTGNMPYQISSPFLLKLLAHRAPWRVAVLMFQKEFAERLLAVPGYRNYSRLAVNTRLFCKVLPICLVRPGSFSPAPQVQSLVVRIEPRERPRGLDFLEWEGMTRLLFRRKRRQMHSIFLSPNVVRMLDSNYRTWCSLQGRAPVLKPMKALVREALNDSGIAHKVPVLTEAEEFFKLLAAFHRKGLRFVNVSEDPEERRAMSVSRVCRRVAPPGDAQGKGGVGLGEEEDEDDEEEEEEDEEDRLGAWETVEDENGDFFFVRRKASTRGVGVFGGDGEFFSARSSEPTSDTRGGGGLLEPPLELQSRSSSLDWTKIASSAHCEGGEHNYEEQIEQEWRIGS